MANRICTVILIVTLFVFVGCSNPIDSGISRREPTRTTTSRGAVNPAEVDEIGLIEEIYGNRQAYQLGLESLVAYYRQTNNNTKLNWAQNELKSLNTMLQYNYIVPIVMFPPEGANSSIPDADLLFEDADILYNQSKIGNLIINTNLALQALRKFEDVIRRYPESDKVDDAAYRAGMISEHFNEYTIAFEFYKGAYELNPDIREPARFKAARILDKQLQRKAEALQLYLEAIETEGRYSQNLEWKNNAEKRVNALQKIEE